MLRLLGQSEYGLYNLVSSFVAYLGLLSFGFDNTYLRYYTQYKHKESKEKVASLNGMFLAVFSVMGLAALIIGSILCCFSKISFLLGEADAKINFSILTLPFYHKIISNFLYFCK